MHSRVWSYTLASAIVSHHCISRLFRKLYLYFFIRSTSSGVCQPTFLNLFCHMMHALCSGEVLLRPFHKIPLKYLNDEGKLLPVLFSCWCPAQYAPLFCSRPRSVTLSLIPGKLFPTSSGYYLDHSKNTRLIDWLCHS